MGKKIGLIILGAIAGVIAVVYALAIVVFGASVSTALGWLVGVAINWIFGTLIVDGMNSLVGTSLVKADIPAITALLAFVSFFFSKNTTENVKTKMKANNTKVDIGK